jgi:hypothetical protein
MRTNEELSSSINPKEGIILFKLKVQFFGSGFTLANRPKNLCRNESPAVG